LTGPGIVFFMVLALSTAGGAAGVIASGRRIDVSTGVAANERISALTSALLLVLVAAIGVTILRIGDMLPEHYLVGFLMLGPLGLKLGSTGYRFLRYYTGNPSYRQAGPPQIVLRLAAPLLVLATGAVFITGIELWLFGYRFGSWWYQAHIITFLVWTFSLAVHLLGHARRSAKAVWDDVALGSQRAFTRRGLVVGSLVLGAVLAAASLFYPSPFQLPGGAG
jgi:hypothetical protein